MWGKGVGEVAHRILRLATNLSPQSLGQASLFWKLRFFIRERDDQKIKPVNIQSSEQLESPSMASVWFAHVQLMKLLCVYSVLLQSLFLGLFPKLLHTGLDLSQCPGFLFFQDTLPFIMGLEEGRKA